MTSPLRLMAILAHPDDESLGTGGTLATYSTQGIETHLVLATRGEHGWFGNPDENPGPTALGQIREAELRAAGEVLGIHDLTFLDYLDGELDRADPAEAIAKIVGQIRRVRPDVIVTFGPDGAYGHPDHIAISQLATAAVVCAADAGYEAVLGSPHRTAKLYYKVWTEAEMALFAGVFGEPLMEVDGRDRGSVGWPEWAITTRLDARSHWPTVWRAIACHRTQLAAYHDRLQSISDEKHERLWGSDGYYRAMSTVNGGRTIESDLFAGLR